ncbi:MAG: SusD/RagB family nutrient-binding outer membrane lipoprotein [Cyclobacteriaceae bacterium]|nr:SusD/RagB family nutrient-binding outer membrane lipoprotein [Cyclobacteriaceae bacterium]
MKKIRSHIMLLAGLLVATSCDHGFDEINTSKTGALAINPVYQLNNAIINTSSGGAAGGSTLIYDIGIVQQIISPNSGVLTGANYNQDNRQATQTLWQGYYRNVIRNTKDIINQTKDVPERSNLMNMARILQAYAFMVLTDAYGDIPYTDAGKGYIDQNFFPAYDPQQAIYADIIQELKSASAALNPSGTIETAEVLYGGDVALWSKFANSLVLRAGMRLSKVDPGTAQSVVSGVDLSNLILTNEDNATIRHDNNYQNAIGVTLNGTEGANFYLTKPFVDHLKNNNDPRLSAVAVRYVGAKSGPEQTVDRASYDPDDQVGMPMGHDNSTIPAVATNLGLASFYDFSQADRRRVSKLTAPHFLVTAAQTNLLLAEARQRGWITQGDAADYFEAGVRAHMEQLGIVDEGSAIDPADIDAYINAHPYDGTLEQINTEYWIACFLNGPEAFANFRRSGYPDLDPNPFPGREVDFIRRLTYPNSEISVNSENVAAAIARMGPDKLDTRVWWDVAN